MSLLVTCLLYFSTSMAFEALSKEVGQFTQSLNTKTTKEEKIKQLSRWVTVDFIKLKPDPVASPQKSAIFIEYNLVLTSLMFDLKSEGSRRAGTGSNLKFNCEHFLTHWQVNLQPKGEVLENKTLINLKPLIEKFCP